MFKQGAFVNILTPEVMHWKESLSQLERLPCLDHVELWLEHIPKGYELREIRSIFRDVEHDRPWAVHPYVARFAPSRSR